MRSLILAAAFAAFGFAQTASAAPVALAPVVIAPQLQTQFDTNYGAREQTYLTGLVVHDVTEALKRQGGDVAASGPITIEVTLVRADPNRPTFEQMGRPPFPDFASFSVGGAELHAVLRSADGRVLTEVSTRRYDPQLDEFVATSSTWAAARRAISVFASDVAAAYREHSQN
ncbi:MAG: hypothetical protein ABUS57_03850 [Pseudomonadota bacterium]